MNHPRSGALAAASLMILLALTGCMSPLPQVEVTLKSGSVIFLSCEPASGVDTIRASVTPAAGGETREVWLLAGEGDFGPEHPITYGEAPDGFVVKSGPEPLALEGVRIRFSLAGFAGGIRYSDTWNFLGDDLREGQWLDRSGQLHDTPCE